MVIAAQSPVGFLAAVFDEPPRDIRCPGSLFGRPDE
jgi:hypothetical protein